MLPIVALILCQQPGFRVGQDSGTDPAFTDSTDAETQIKSHWAQKVLEFHHAWDFFRVFCFFPEKWKKHIMHTHLTYRYT